MNRNTRLLGLALVGVAALLLPLNADATCSTSASFGSYYSGIVGTSAGPSLRANFWVLDQGDPTVGLGVDNGLVTDSYWIFNSPGKTPGPVVLGDWSGPANPTGIYDGCPNDLPNGGATSSMVFSLSDVNGAGNMTYAVICATRNIEVSPQYDLGFIASFIMVVAPKATITNLVRTPGSYDVTITVASPNFAAGFYGDGSPNCIAANAIPLYDVYKQQTARDALPSPSIDAVPPWVLAATCNMGSPCTLPAINSPTNTDIYLAVSPHFNSNFTTGEAASGAPARVGVKSAKIHAGPILADTPRPRPVPHPRPAPPRPQDRQ